MDDPNVFAILTPHGTREGADASKAFRQPHNKDRYFQGADSISDELSVGSRATTPARHSQSSTDLESSDRIVLKFSDPTINLAEGLKFGTNPKTSDILLRYPGMKGISSSQFVFTVQGDGSWYLEDSHSRYGTAVGYDNQAEDEWRREERWIIAHKPNQKRQWKKLIVYAGGLAFKVHFPNQQAGRPEYVENLQDFIRRSRTALPAINALGMDSHLTTGAPSEPRTPYRCLQPIYIDLERIGHGTFAEVYKVMSNRDGRFYAMKKFTQPMEARKRKRYQQDWYDTKRREAEIMKGNAHRNVMPIIHSIEEPGRFSIVMPYYELGSLQDYEPSEPSYGYSRAFLQILLALSWLHGRGVVHRDVKPENFLIETEDPLNIILADFGLSNIVTDHPLKTFCGSHTYCAPEVYPGNSDGYGPKADIWSLGVMMLQLMYDLPSAPRLPRIQNPANLLNWATGWSQKLHAKLSECADQHDPTIHMLSNMIKVDPVERYTANECLQKGVENGLFRMAQDGYIISANDTEANTPAEAAWQADSPGDGASTPRSQSTRGAKSTANDHSIDRSIVIGGLWDSSALNQNVGTNKIASADAQSSSGGFAPGPQRPRRRLSPTSTWSLTVGPESTDSNGGIESDEGRIEGATTLLRIKKDHFTASMEEQSASKPEVTGQTANELQKRITSVGQGSPVLLVPEEDVAEPVVLASFEERVVHLLE
ncbi:MAG: hypothetical protein Q9171_002258 [Xanthocarpia ochracea]